MTNNRIFFAVLLIFCPLLLAAADWPAVLNEFEKEENPQTALSILTEFEKTVSDPKILYEIFTRKAHLYDFLGDYRQAQECYEKAFSVRPSEPDFNMLLHSAALLIETNQIERAENQLDICLARCSDDVLLSQTYFYFAYAAFLKGEAKTSAACVQKILDINVKDTYESVKNYLPWIALFASRYPKEFAGITDLLKTAGYPIEPDDFDLRLLSPALMLAENGVTEKAAVDFQEESESQKPQKRRLIVAGSYSLPENADAVLRDLEMQGLSGKIRKITQNGKIFYRIYVLPIEDDYERTVGFLKSLDIEAFIVNDVY